MPYFHLINVLSNNKKIKIKNKKLIKITKILIKND